MAAEHIEYILNCSLDMQCTWVRIYVLLFAFKAQQSEPPVLASMQCLWGTASASIWYTGFFGGMLPQRSGELKRKQCHVG
jgi:hypothetical protein